jgi:hypothetical protein
VSNPQHLFQVQKSRVRPRLFYVHELSLLPGFLTRAIKPSLQHLRYIIDHGFAHRCQEMRRPDMSVGLWERGGRSEATARSKDRSLRISSERDIRTTAPVGAGLPAKDVNEDGFQQDKRAHFEFFAGKPAPTGIGVRTFFTTQ